MEKGLKMTIKVSQKALEQMIQRDKNHPENLFFEEENEQRGTQKNESE